MAKKPQKVEKMVRVKILPGRGIGGYGEAGDVVEMPESEAEYYVQEGYVSLVTGKPDQKAEKAEE